ncbi:MAG: hypothetical protein IIA59_09635 [Candidatus Marinimicrobia bacterium]|nr:hypothetical protein [Candidatus Neomarinimicrobiota bacterium]
MRKLALLIALSLSACESDDSWTGTVQLDTPFELSQGEFAILDDSGLEITFVSVEEDSRCPADVDCIYGGQVIVRLSLYFEMDVKADFLLGSNWDELFSPGTFDTLGYRISLLGVGPPAANSGVSIPAEDYLVRIEVMEPWLEGTINLFDTDSYSNYVSRLTGLDEWSPMWVAGDTLIVPVRYGGGCKVHDFYLVGTCPPQSTYSSPLVINVIHEGNGDACKAYLAKRLKFDLSPLRRCGLKGRSVAIQYIGRTATVMYGL